MRVRVVCGCDHPFINIHSSSCCQEFLKVPFHELPLNSCEVNRPFEENTMIRCSGTQG